MESGQPEGDAIHWLSQDGHMKEEEREAFLQEFEKERDANVCRILRYGWDFFRRD